MNYTTCDRRHQVILNDSLFIKVRLSGSSKLQTGVVRLPASPVRVLSITGDGNDLLRLSPIISDMSIIIFIIKHPYHSGRNVMLEPGRLCVGDRPGLPGLCVFLGNTSVVLTWAGTGRVDISVQLLVGFVIIVYIINAGLKL